MGNAPPYNRIFTGRTDELATLHSTLHTDNAALTPDSAALHGMGGVGKTQTARQYVHLHQANYAVMCWVLGVSPETFQAEMANLAPELDAAIPASNDQQSTYKAVKGWLETHGDWLLVIDNAENLSQLRLLLPHHKTGRVLLTTRETVPTTLAKSLEIHHLDDETGATLLLRRANLLQDKQLLTDIDPTTQADALKVSADLGGLALALEAAGAYIQVRTISVAKYREYYAQRRQQLHKENSNPDHESVTVTFSLALEQIEKIPNTGKAAAELVRMCAFLAPDAIPNEIFLQGVQYLEPELARFANNEIDFSDVAATACRYSLIRQDEASSGLWMHRLAQEVICDSLSEEEQKTSRAQIVFTVNAAFPETEFEHWELCEQLLSHAMLCEHYFDRDFLYNAQAARLFDGTSQYLAQRARYAEAERLFRQALAISKRVHGIEHENVASILNNLGRLLIYRGQYEQAEEMLRQTIEIDRNTIGEDNPTFAKHLDNLARSFYYQGNCEDALPLAQRALDIAQRHHGTDHRDVAHHLNTLATVFSDMGDFEEAIARRLEALKIGRITIGIRHPHYAKYLQNLASTYILWCEPEQAEEPLQQALSLYVDIFGIEHTYTASCYSWLGKLRCVQKKYKAAADCFERALTVQERTLGADHHHTENSRLWLADMKARI